MRRNKSRMTFYEEALVSTWKLKNNYASAENSLFLLKKEKGRKLPLQQIYYSVSSPGLYSICKNDYWLHHKGIAPALLGRKGNDYVHIAIYTFPSFMAFPSEQKIP